MARWVWRTVRISQRALVLLSSMINADLAHVSQQLSVGSMVTVRVRNTRNGEAGGS